MPVGVELWDKWYGVDYNQYISLGGTAMLPGATTDPGLSWTDTPVSIGVGTSAYTFSDDITPPRLIATSAANDNDGIQAQWTDPGGTGEIFSLIAGKKIYFSCEFLISDAADLITTVEQVDVFYGLAVTITTAIAGCADYIGFYKADGSGVVNFVAGKNSTTFGDQLVVPTGVTLVAADAGTAAANLNSFAFVMDGTDKAVIYANGEQVATTSSLTQFPDDVQMCPTMAMLNGEAVVKIVHTTKFCALAER